MSDNAVIKTIIAEAGGDPKAQAAVAWVIANRAAKEGKTPDQIVKAHGQFEGYSNPGPSARKAQQDAKVLANTKQVWANVKAGTIPDPTNGGTMYHASYVSPYWAKSANQNGKVNIGGNVFYKGNSPGTPLEAIEAVAPVPHPSLPAQTSAYANLPATTPPPLPIPRPSNPAGVRSVEINPDGSLKAPDLSVASLQPFAGGLNVQPHGAGDFWGPDTGRWGPSSFANAFPPPVPDRAPSAPLVSRSVHTVAIDPLTGNPHVRYDGIGAGPESWFKPSPVASAAPKSIAYNSTAGNVALPPGVVPASVTRDLAAIKAMQANTSGSPDDRNSPPPILTAPVPMPSRPSSLNAPYIPGPSSAPKTAEQLSPSSASLPFAYGDPAPTAPAVQAITHVLNPAYTAALKAGQAYTAGGNIVTQAQQNAFGGLNVPTVAPPTRPLPPKYISVRVPTVPVPQAAPPMPIPRPASPAPVRRSGGLLGLLFPGTDQNAFSLMGQAFGPAASAPPATAPTASTNASDYLHSDAPIGVLARQAGAGAQLPNSVVNSTRWQTGY